MSTDTENATDVACQLKYLTYIMSNFHSRTLPCCHFGEDDALIVSGTVISSHPNVVVRDMHVIAATVYQMPELLSVKDFEDAYHRSTTFKVWCQETDPQLPPDGDTRLWFDFSSPDTEVSVVVKRAE